MTTLAKFKFETSFDAPKPDEADAETAPPPPPAFCGEDVARAREEGEAAGRQAGLAEAAAGIEAQQSAALEAIAAALSEQAPLWRARLEDAHRETLTIARAVLAKTVPDIARDNAMALIETAITSVLPKLMDEPRAVIRVSGTLLDALQTQLDGIKRKVGYSGDLILLSEPDFGPADCTIEWADGGAEYHQDAIWKDIQEAMDRFFAAAVETAPAEAVPEEMTKATTQPEPEETPHG